MVKDKNSKDHCIKADEKNKQQIKDTTFFKEQELFAKLIETSPVGIVYVNTSGNITFANSEAERLLKLSKDNITKRTYHDPRWHITNFEGEHYPKDKLPFELVKKSLQPVFDIEHAIKHQDGSMTYLSINASPLLDENQKFNGMVAAIEDITHIYLTQKELDRKKSEVEQLFNISTPLCLISKDFEMLRINDSFCYTFQVKREDIVGKQCHEIWHGPLCKTDDCMLKSILAGEETDSYELRKELPDKSKKDFIVQAKPYLDEKGSIIGIVEIFTDITKEKEAIEQIETIWNVSHDLLCVADYHTATFLKVNPSFTHVLGFDEAELLSKPFLEFVHPDDVTATIKVIEEKLKQGVTVLDFTNRYRCKDGSYRYLQWISRPIKERGCTYAIARDITQQKKQQEELQQKTEKIEMMNEELLSQNEELNELLQRIKESEETYRNLFQNAQVGLFRTRISDGKIVESNEQLVKMFGYTDKDEFIEEYYTSQNYVDAGTRERMLEKIIENGSIQNFEARFYRKDKSIFWARYSARVYPKKGWIEGVAEDITNQKIAEEALKKEKEWSENIVNNAPNIIVGLGERSKIFVFNHYAEKLTGYSAEEVIGKEWIEIFIPQEMKGTIYKVWEEIVENQLIDHHFENEIVTKSGEKRLIEWSNTILTEDGKFRMILSLGVDITERKQSEEKIKAKNLFLESLIQQLPLPTFVMDSKGFVMMVNEAFLKFYAVPGKEIVLGRNALTEPANIKQGVIKYFREALSGNIVEMPEIEFISPHKNKKVITHGRLFPIFDQTDTLTNVVVIQEDITERKQAEEALKESEALLKATGNIAKVGGWELDAHTNKVSWTEETYRIHEVPLDYEPPLEEAINFFHPDDRDKLDTAMKHALEKGESYDLELRFISGNGKRLWTRTVCEPDIVDGKVVKLKGIFQDITARKEAEEELKYRLALLQIAEETARFGGWSVDLRDYSCTWSDAVADIHEMPNGFAPKVSESINFYAPEWRDKITEVFTACAEKGIPYDEEMQIITKNGKRVWVRTIGRAVKDKKGEIIHVEGSFQDINEQKKAEEEIKESQERLLAILNGIQEPIYIADPGTYEMIFANKVVIDIFGDPEGKKCYQYLQNRDDPCPFCTNDKILGENRDESYIWEFQNMINKRWYRCIDKAIKWPDGRIVRYEMAIDINERKKAEEALKQNEERLRLFFESPVFGTLHGDIYGKVYEANDEYLRIIGYIRDELDKGEVNWEKITPKEDLVLDREHIKEAQQKGVCTPYEKRYIRKDGSLIWVLVGYALIGEKREESMAFIIDIQENKEYQETLEKRNEFIQTVLDNLPIGVALNEIDKGTATYINDKFADIYGWPKEELEDIKKFFRKVFPDDEYRKRMKKKIMEDINSGDPDRMHWEDVVATGNDGSKHWINAVNIPMFEQNVTVSTVMDITELKKTQQELMKMKESLEIEVAEKTKELNERLRELERFHDATVNREFRIKELKDEIERLKKEKDNG